jgi:hypothetical protein
MVGRVLKVVGYAKAPVKTFMVLHPLRALKWGAAYLVIRKVMGMQKKPV